MTTGWLSMPASVACSRSKPEELDVIMLYYVYGLTKREIGRRIRVSEMEVRRRISIAEGFIEGCLCMLGFAFRWILRWKNNDLKKVLVRVAKTALRWYELNF
jgi:hypothetical protein